MISFPPLLVWALFAAVASFFFLLAIVVYFHLRRYSIPGDRTAFIRHIFLAGNIVLFLLSLFALLRVPWETLFP